MENTVTDALISELEGLSSSLALLDEEDPRSMEVARTELTAVLDRLKSCPTPVKRKAAGFRRAARAFLEGEAGGFEALSRALDRLIIALQTRGAPEKRPTRKTSPRTVEAKKEEGSSPPDMKPAGAGSEPPDAGLTDREAEELRMDLEVLAGLAEELQPSFVPGMVNILERNLDRLRLPRPVRSALAAVRDLLLRFEGGDPEVHHEVAEGLRRLVDGLHPGDASFSDEGSGKEAEGWRLLEEELDRLEELESILLSEESREVPDLGAAVAYLRDLSFRAKALGLDGFSGAFADASEALASRSPRPEVIDTLLKLKDCLSRHLRASLEGGGGKAGPGEIRELLHSVTSGDTAFKGEPGEREVTDGVQATSEHELLDTIEADEDELADFVAEAPEDVQRVETALLELEKNPTSREWLNEAFRGFHNLKGGAGFLNLRDMVSVAHAAENLLSEAREGRVELTGAYADLALQALDLIKEMLAGVEGFARGGNYRTPEKYPLLMERFRTLMEGGGTAEEKAASDSTAGSADTASARTSSTRDAREHPREEAIRTPTYSEGAAGIGGSRERFVKVSTERLDNLVDVVGELVIAHSMVAQEKALQMTSDPRLAKNLSQLSKIIRELQELAMSLRMVSLRSTFQKMARAARDLSVRSGVPVEFTYSGEDTEIDRNVVEEIANPLVHMIRNAIDHGIEPPEERKAAGKPEAGRIHLRGYHQGGNVVIELEDDGRGIDHRKVLDRARSLGLVREGEEPSRDELLQLVFLEGFSTAERVTDISGRGVGMDVVKRTVEALRGRVEIHSTPGQGTRVTLRLPLTLAIIDGMVTRVADENYILPSIAILESFRPVPGQVKTVSGRGEMILSRGELIPLFRLHRLFAVDGAVEDPCQALVLVLGENGRKCGLLVDDIEGQQQVVIKPLGDSLPRLPGVAGGAIMGSGRVALIIDPQELLAEAARR